MKIFRPPVLQNQFSALFSHKRMELSSRHVLSAIFFGFDAELGRDQRHQFRGIVAKIALIRSVRWVRSAKST